MWLVNIVQFVFSGTTGLEVSSSEIQYEAQKSLKNN